jgi:hypothetical protein
LQFNTSNGDLIEFSSTNSSAVINFAFVGSYTQYGFGSNGLWSSPLIMAALNAYVGYMDFKFLGGTVSAAGGFLNYAPGFPDDMYIAALDGGGNVLETYDLSFATGGGVNTGATYYIHRSNSDIATLRLGDSFVGIANFTYNAPVSPVPGPLPVVAAAAAFGYSRRLRKRVAACSVPHPIPRPGASRG